MERITRDALYMEVAAVISKRATCGRAKVGCVITINNRIVSTGYNGPPSGLLAHNGLGNGRCRCDLKNPCSIAIHAEANAIYAAAKAGISLEGGKLYCLYSPCRKCTEAIIQAGISEVYFAKAYRDEEPMELLGMHGILLNTVEWPKELGIE
jgi:dCMP deaminase